jgi:hypothetical protein
MGRSPASSVKSLQFERNILRPHFGSKTEPNLQMRLTSFGDMPFCIAMLSPNYRTLQHCTLYTVHEMGFVQGPQKLNDGSRKTIRLGMIDRGFTVSVS